MSWVKVVAVCVLAALPAGVAVALVRNEETVRAPMDESPMILPVGRSGDHLTYAVYDRWNDRCYYGAGAPLFDDFYEEGDYRRLSGVQTFRIAGTGAARDMHSNSHDIVQIEWNGSIHWDLSDISIFPESRTFFSTEDYDPDWYENDESWARKTFAPCDWPEGTGHAPAEAEAAPPKTLEELLARAAELNTQQRRQFVDLTSRTVVRDELLVPFHDDLTTLRTNESGELVPIVHESFPGQAIAVDLGPAEVELTGLHLQGRTIRLGDVLTPETQVPQWNSETHVPWSNGVDERGWRVGPPVRLAGYGWVLGEDGLRPWIQQLSAEVESITVREWVEERSTINGQDAYGIYTEVLVRYRAPSPPGQEPFEWKTWRNLIINWMTPNLPYPILVQSNRFDRVLVDYQPGDAPIAWMPISVEPPMTEAEPPVERSSSNQLEDGTALPLRYGLAEALSDVQRDPDLAAWLAAHSEAVLAAADYSEEAAGFNESVWRLAFATPPGEAYEVHARRDAVTEIINVGARLVPAFDVDAIPDAPVTISAAVELWRAHAGPRFASERPNAMHWGQELWVPSGTHRSATICRPLGEFRDGNGFETDPSHRLHGWQRQGQPQAELRVGHESFSPCESGTKYVRTSSFLTLATGSASVVALWEDDAAFASPEHAIGPAAPADLVRPATIRLEPPDIERATLVTASVAAVLLSVYLAPVAHFALTKASLLIPGYTKLARERLLDNRVRDGLLQAIQNDPGVNATELGRRTQAAWGTVVYHLSVLERNKMVSSLVDGRHRRFFPIGGIDWTRRGQVAALKHEQAKTLFDLIQDEPGAIQEHLAARIGLSRASTIWHLQRLETCGLVGRVKKGRKVHYYPNEPAQTDPVDPSPGMETA